MTSRTAQIAQERAVDGRLVASELEHGPDDLALVEAGNTELAARSHVSETASAAVGAGRRPVPGLRLPLLRDVSQHTAYRALALHILIAIGADSLAALAALG